MFKKHMTPLKKGGQLVAHQGKGSSMTGMPDRKQITQLQQPGGQSMNDYAKATPMANPMPAPFGGLGDGDWPGIGQ